MSNKRVRVMNKTGGLCWYCGKTLNTSNNGNVSDRACLDHVIPQSRGGSNDESNLVPCCRSCNSSKQNKLVEEWRHRLCNIKKPRFSRDQEEYLARLGIDVDTLPDSIRTSEPPVFYFEETEEMS
jgi:5-methylcytosine-specific restriction endonuclease McrA